MKNLESPNAKNSPGLRRRNAMRSFLSILKYSQSSPTACSEVVFSESFMRAEISPTKYPFLISKLISASGQSTNLNSPALTIILNFAYSPTRQMNESFFAS